MSAPAIQTDVETPVETPEPYKSQHAKVLRFEISVGADDDATTLEQFENLVREALAFARDHGPSVYADPEDQFKFHNLTIQGGYYLIDGKVCMPNDYDPASKNRKPGTYPPQWAGGPDPKKVQLPTATDDDDDEIAKPREFVRVKPTRSNERHPVTGRRVRKDKGVKRGPKKTEEEQAAATEVIAKLSASARKEITK